jgi:hypothetical protein
MKHIVVVTLCVVVGSTIAYRWLTLTNPQMKIFPSPIQNKTNETSKFSLDQAPSDSIRGIISEMSGSVWWESRMATTPAKLSGSTLIQQGEKIIASDAGKLTVSFASSSAIMLSPDTEVDVVQTLPTNLVFHQIKGSAQYQVSGASPVSVRSLNMIVNVKKGLITIDTNVETGDIALTLKSGAATVAYNSPEFVSKVWELEPGDIFEYNSDERKGYFK